MIREQEVEQGPVPSTWFRVDVVTDVAVFAAMRREWDALLDESTSSVFNSWEWLYPWYRRIGADRSLRILTARGRDGRLMGLLPLGLESRRVWGRTVRRLAFLGETHVGSDYLDVVAHRGAEEAVARAFAAYLRMHSASYDVLELTDFDGASPTVRIFLEAFADGFAVDVSERYVCPYETLAPEPFDDFLRRTGRRDNYLRRRKWLEKQPGYRIERVEFPGQLAPAMSHFFRLHSMRWAEDGGSQGIKGPSVEAFHREATQLLAERKQLRLYTMMVGDQAVASVYAIRHGGKFLYYQSGYDPAWRSKSVGLVLVGETFKDSLEAGLSEYDFLRGTEGYKADWTSKQRKTVALRMYAPTLMGRWLPFAERAEKAAREVAKRLLPKATVERIRRLRRKRAAI